MYAAAICFFLQETSEALLEALAQGNSCIKEPVLFTKTLTYASVDVYELDSEALV